jgi:hypothetical protein
MIRAAATSAATPVREFANLLPPFPKISAEQDRANIRKAPEADRSLAHPGNLPVASTHLSTSG